MTASATDRVYAGGLLVALVTVRFVDAEMLVLKDCVERLLLDVKLLVKIVAGASRYKVSVVI
jgi:hypothetical protein